MGMAQVAVLFLEKPGLDSGLKLKAGQGSNLPPTSWLLQPRALGAVHSPSLAVSTRGRGSIGDNILPLAQPATTPRFYLK